MDLTIVASPGIVLHPPLRSPLRPPNLSSTTRERYAEHARVQFRKETSSVLESDNEHKTMTLAIFGDSCTDQKNSDLNSEEYVKKHAKEEWTQEFIRKKIMEALQVPLNDGD